MKHVVFLISFTLVFIPGFGVTQTLGEIEAHVDIPEIDRTFDSGREIGAAVDYTFSDFKRRCPSGGAQCSFTNCRWEVIAYSAVCLVCDMKRERGLYIPASNVREDVLIECLEADFG